MLDSRNWCIFWIVWCSVFFVWDVAFAVIDGGWWILFFAFFACVMLWCGRHYLNRLFYLNSRQNTLTSK